MNPRYPKAGISTWPFGLASLSTDISRALACRPSSQAGFGLPLKMSSSTRTIPHRQHADYTIFTLLPA